MKVFELAKILDTTPKELITFFKDKGYKVSSHMQNLTDDMIDIAQSDFKKQNDIDEVVEEFNENKTEIIQLDVQEQNKVFKSDDQIPCRSVTPWALNALSVDKNKVYHWRYFGDIDYLEYRDLQALRRSEYITKPKILIEDAALCYQWRRELGDTYKYFLDVEYPEEFFDLSDEKFKNLLAKAPDVLKEVIKTTALNMIKNKNYPSYNKLDIIDETLGTCLKSSMQ